MTQAMENNRWWREKRPVVDEYLTTAKKVENVIAGQGFLYRPGFLNAAITDIERMSKFKLSDINYQIVKEAIERELAQTGHDYDIAFKEAQISWELEKATLFTDLQEEFTDNKRVRDLDTQQLDRLEITTNLRKLVIMAAKTAIDVEMEGYRQEMTLVEQSTFNAEDALLAAKLVTARKKLDVIPYINDVLDKQQLIIDAEYDNIERKEALIIEKARLNDKRGDLITAREAIAAVIVDLIAAKQALVTKRESLITAKGLIATQERTNIGYLDAYISALSGLTVAEQSLITAKKALIPYINNKSLALISYASELDAWVIVKEAIAGIKEDIAGYMEDRVDKKGDIIDVEVDLNNLRLDLKEAEINLRIAKLTGRSNLMRQKVENAAEMLTERQEAFDSKIERESALTSGSLDLELYEALTRFDTSSQVNDIEFEGLRDNVVRVAAAAIRKAEEIADIQASARLTSELVHILS